MFIAFCRTWSNPKCICLFADTNMTCSFHWEVQQRLECGRHAINCLLGGPVITHSLMQDINDHMIMQNPALRVFHCMSFDANYDLTLLQRVLLLLTSVQHFQLQFRTLSHVLWTKMSPNPSWAILISMQLPCAHWYAIRYNAQTGMWWNLDSLHAPIRMNIATLHTLFLIICTKDARFYPAKIQALLKNARQLNCKWTQTTSK